MLRCRIEIVPHGIEELTRTIGMVEIANTGKGNSDIGEYIVVLKKSPPFEGALRAAWKKGKIVIGSDDEDVIIGEVKGHPRERRGVYDLLYRALKSCGLEDRIPK